MSGYDQRGSYSLKTEDQDHIGSVWMALLTLDVVFIFFTGTLLGYHTYLILAGQTTWEHARKHSITYLKIYPTGVMPFYEGMWGNVKRTFCHGGQCNDWDLGQPNEIRERQGFNFCENEYYSCC